MDAIHSGCQNIVPKLYRQFLYHTKKAVRFAGNLTAFFVFVTFLSLKRYWIQGEALQSIL